MKYKLKKIFNSFKIKTNSKKNKLMKKMIIFKKTKIVKKRIIINYKMKKIKKI